MYRLLVLPLGVRKRKLATVICYGIKECTFLGGSLIVGQPRRGTEASSPSLAFLVEYPALSSWVLYLVMSRPAR